MDDGLAQTIDHISRAQYATGLIPWSRGGFADPWNHVEAAMALDAGGRHENARRAFEWLARHQRRDGAWAARYLHDTADDPTLDANFTSYVAAGVWHHWLWTEDDFWLRGMWPVVEAAVDFALDLQQQDGSISWARDRDYRPWPGALLTSSACICLSLRSAMRVAARVGESRPDWELSLAALERFVAARDPAVIPKDRFAMDWYYPVLAGAVPASQAGDRLRAQWTRFVVPERGCRCVADRPWVTAAETCELVIALRITGMDEEANRLLDWVQRLRSGDGSYWMGATHPDGVRWPRERTTWSAAAVVLAACCCDADGPTRALFQTPAPDLLEVSEPVSDTL